MAIVALGRNIHSDHCTEFLYLDLHMTDLIGYHRHFPHYTLSASQFSYDMSRYPILLS